MAYVDMGISGSYSNPSSSVRGYIALFDEVDIQKAAREYVEKHLTSAISRIFSVYMVGHRLLKWLVLWGVSTRL